MALPMTRLRMRLPVLQYLGFRLRPATRPAPRVEVAYDAAGHRALAFNLAWRSIATGGGRQDAFRIARAAGASHVVTRAGQVGMGVVAQQPGRSGVRLLPAALVAARQHPGTAVCCLEIAPGEFWLALTIHGAPTSTDLFLSGLHAQEALARAQEILDGLDPAVAATLYTNIAGCTLPHARPYTPADMLAAPASEDECLRPLPPSAPARRLLLPALLLLSATLAWHQHRSRTEASRRAAELAAASSRSPDLHSAWDAAVAQWAMARPMPKADALRSVRAGLGELPVHWHGWVLAQAGCQATEFDAGPPAGRTWHCEAAYRRGPVSLPNREMAGRVPAGWRLVYQPLGELQLGRVIREDAEALQLAQLPTAAHYEIEVASRLQQLSPALAGEVRIVFAPVAVPAPADPAGQPLPSPPLPALPSRADLHLRGPLRSIDALAAADIAAHWHAIQVTFHPSADADGALRPALADSALMVDLKGEFLAKP